MTSENPFVDLRRLVDWFATQPTRPSLHVERIIARLGAVSVPLLGRELCSHEPARRDAARTALVQLADGVDPAARSRVIEELRAIASSDVPDDQKVRAVGLLGELGERGTARFADPTAIQRRSALALAAQLESAADIASAADLMVRQMADDEIVQLVAALADAAPAGAHRVGAELCVRLDLAAELRERIAEVALLHLAQPHPRATRGDDLARRGPRPTHVTVLIDGRAPCPAVSAAVSAAERRCGSIDGRAPCPAVSAAERRCGSIDGRAPCPAVSAAERRCGSIDGERTVVVATRKISGERRWRRWAVLIDAVGQIDDCIHEERAGDAGDAAALIASLVADGYHATSTELEHAREVVARAARRTGAANEAALPSAYYVGRDLLDLGDAHLTRARIHPTSATLGRAVELIAEGDLTRAQHVLARSDGSGGAEIAAEIAAATAACLLAEHRPGDAIPHLTRAIELEPGWPLHHWNLATASHQLGDAATCYQALVRFVGTSAAPSGLAADPDQPGRMALAIRLMAELERTARLAGTPLTTSRRRKRRTRSARQR